MASRRQRQYWMQMQRQSSDESYSSSPTSSPKPHRRSSSFNGLPSPELGSPGSNIITKSSLSKTDNHLHVSWSSGTIASSRANPCSPESKMIRRKTVGGGGEDTSFRAYELIRQLSFSPPQTETKKRANTAETEVGSSFDSDSSSDRHPIGLDLELDLDMDLKQGYTLRRGRSPSPLLGLKYLPDEEDMFI